MAREILEAEVDSDGRDVGVFELVVSESLEDGGLAHRGRAHDHKLEHIVILALHF